MLPKPKQYQKHLQRLHHHQKARFSCYLHKYTCFVLAKVCWFSWCLFRSINFCFEPRYVHLHLKVKKRKNFLVNLIFLFRLKIVWLFGFTACQPLLGYFISKFNYYSFQFYMIQKHIFTNILNTSLSQTYLTHKQVLLLQVRVNLGVMAMNGWLHPS